MVLSLVASRTWTATRSRTSYFTTDSLFRTARGSDGTALYEFDGGKSWTSTSPTGATSR